MREGNLFAYVLVPEHIKEVTFSRFSTIYQKKKKHNSSRATERGGLQRVRRSKKLKNTWGATFFFNSKKQP